MKTAKSTAFCIATCGLTMATFADFPSGSQTQAALPAFGLPAYTTLPVGGDFEVANPANPQNPFGWTNNNDFADAQWIAPPGPSSPPAPPLGSRVITIGPLTGGEFRSFNTDTQNFFQTGTDPATGNGFIAYFDPTFDYNGGDVTVTGWYMIRASESLTAAPAAIKMDAKGGGNNFQNNATFDPWGRNQGLITGNTNGQWVQYSLTWPIADIRAEFENNVLLGFFPANPKPDRMKLTIGRFNAGTALAPGRIYWDNILLTQASGSNACNPADICGVGATYDAGTVDIGPDGQLTIEDFLNFLAAFGDGTGCSGTAPCNPADICGVGATYDAGTVDVGPDGELTIEDFLNFLAAFGDATGCP